MNDLQRHRERIEEFFTNIETISNDANTLFILTNEMDFMAMDVLMKMLRNAMVNGDLPELTEHISKFCQGKLGDDASEDLINDVLNRDIN
tara:strand:+ start:311 stop:580 length:270 start_codon:yes stop_codon:yes gene_type:complete